MVADYGTVIYVYYELDEKSVVHWLRSHISKVHRFLDNVFVCLRSKVHVSVYAAKAGLTNDISRIVD